jgi:DNA-binding transcriptional ArsR family regulator
MLKALAHPHRLMIICQLIERERAVGELADLLRLRDSTVSQHLALLRKDGLVKPRREGQTIWYSIASAPARELLATLYRVYCGPQLRCEPGPKRANPPRRHNPSKQAPARRK